MVSFFRGVKWVIEATYECISSITRMYIRAVVAMGLHTATFASELCGLLARAVVNWAWFLHPPLPSRSLEMPNAPQFVVANDRVPHHAVRWLGIGQR